MNGAFRFLLNNSLKISVFKRAFSNHHQLGAEKTCLYDFHVKNGGKIVNFGGFLLPVQYSDQSLVNSHIFTRNSASIFDVSHMLQTEIRGKNCIEYFQSLCTADIKNLPNNSGTLTVFTNDQGGILDDLIVTKINEEFLYIVSNAAMKKQDQKIMLNGLENYTKSQKNTNIEIKFFEPKDRALLALQGPKSAEILQKFTEIDLTKLYFMNTSEAELAGSKNCRITRCGYTGEDGFEISIPAKNAAKITEELLKNENVRLAGLGARDSLRLEAGLCLYGSDINSETTPVEAALTWLINKNRREMGDFPGSDKILQQIKDGSKIKRIGIISKSGEPPARHGTQILTLKGDFLGEISSGCPSPTLKLNISMGYVPIEYSKIGTKLSLKIRDKIYEGIVTKMPFTNTNYYNRPKKLKA